MLAGVRDLAAVVRWGGETPCSRRFQGTLQVFFQAELASLRKSNVQCQKRKLACERGFLVVVWIALTLARIPLKPSLEL